MYGSIPVCTGNKAKHPADHKVIRMNGITRVIRVIRVVRAIKGVIRLLGG